jgi:hypothetical protein
MLMAHRSAKRQLHVNRNRDSNRKRLDRREFLRVNLLICERPPEICRQQRNNHEQPEKCLRDTGVKDSNFIFHHGDAKPAKDSLKDYAGQRDYAQVAHPSSRFAEAEPDSENDGQKPNERTHQAMGVLEQNSADPLGDWEKKHVVAKRGRPIGHGEPDVFTRHHSAAANEQERGDASQPCESVQPCSRSPHGREYDN